jgi:hypothetical protein
MINDENVSNFFDNIEDSQLKLILDILEKSKLEESGNLEAHQTKEIVPVEQWLNSSYFLGPFAKELFPFWKKNLPNYLNSKRPELIIGGSIGGGKSFAALIAAIRKIYELSCYDSPQRLFGLSDSTDIYFAYLSINMTQAERTGFGQLRTMVDAIPYFQKEFKRDDQLKTMIKFPSKICVIPGSDSLSVISMNLYGSIMDEADFYRKGSRIDVGDIGKANKIYKEISDRRISRFMVKGYDPGFSAIISSASFQSSFVTSRIKKARRDGSATIIEARLWDTKPENYSKDRFFVFKGSEKQDAYLIEGPEDLLTIASDSIKPVIQSLYASSKVTGNSLIKEILSVLPNKFQDNFLPVPTDFLPSFKEDVFTSLRNLGGVATAPIGRLFSSHVVWSKNLSLDLQHPFTKPLFTVSVKGTDHVMTYFKPEVLFEKEGGGKFFGLKRHPSALRYAHFDYSTTSCRTGISVVHISHYIEDNNTYLRVPVIETDFNLAIEAPKPPDKISFAKIREFFFSLAAMGMKFGLITLDQYQSEDTIQIFTTRGIETKRVSKGITDAPYVQVVELLYEGRLSHYNYEILSEEWFHLLHDDTTHKVDHPSVYDDGRKAYKDVSDSWVCAVDACIKSSDANALDYRQAMLDLDPYSHVDPNEDDVDPTENVDETWVPVDYKSPDGDGSHITNIWDENNQETW